MIDLHCHILAGLDDGAPDCAASVEMARLAAAEGTIVLACTPHFMPGVYDTALAAARRAMADLAERLRQEDIFIDLVMGGDLHATPHLAARLKRGEVPTLGGSRYLLLEPPHDVLPPRFEELTFELIQAGYAPILTHPERLKWIESRYGVIRRLAEAGVLMQLTSGSVIGRFGGRPQYWSERMLDEGFVDFLATDAHNVDRRPPDLARGRDRIAALFGEDLALDLVLRNPRWVLENRSPDDIRPRSVHGEVPNMAGNGERGGRRHPFWPF